jgi:NAD-dependent dihydropyrimidine dehydrogenase PreA subunit
MAYVVTQPCAGSKDHSCVSVCPVEAIFPEKGVPLQWRDSIPLNAAYFAPA